MRQPFLLTLAWGLLLMLPWSVESPDSADREGEGVYVKTRCIQPTATMPIVDFALPRSYEGKPEWLPFVVSSALRYEGVQEEPDGSNSSPEIDTFLAAVGLGPGYPYCASFTAFCDLTVGRRGPISTSGDTIQSAGARNYQKARHTLSPEKVHSAKRTVPVGARVIWGVRGSWKGHVGWVIGDEKGGLGVPWRGRCGKTIEANTSPPS